MKEVTKYIADDGTEFNTEWECLRYEDKWKLSCYYNDFKLFDEGKFHLFFENAEPCEVYYITVKNPCAVEALSKWFDNCGELNPFEFIEPKEAVGTWVYTDSDRGWIKIENEIAKLEETIAELNS